MLPAFFFTWKCMKKKLKNNKYGILHCQQYTYGTEGRKSNWNTQLPRQSHFLPVLIFFSLLPPKEPDFSILSYCTSIWGQGPLVSFRNNVKKLWQPGTDESKPAMVEDTAFICHFLLSAVFYIYIALLCDFRVGTLLINSFIFLTSHLTYSYWSV